MVRYRPGKISERRRGPDSWMKAMSWLGVTGWLLMVAAMIIIEKAKPPFETVATRFFNVRLRSTWDAELTRYLLWMMYLGLLISISGLVINAKRLSRKNDQLHINLILLLVISLFGISMYIFFLL